MMHFSKYYCTNISSKWDLQIPRQTAEIQAGDRKLIDLDLLRPLPATHDSDYSIHCECHKSIGRLGSKVTPPSMESPQSSRC